MGLVIPFCSGFVRNLKKQYQLTKKDNHAKIGEYSIPYKTGILIM